MYTTTTINNQITDSVTQTRGSILLTEPFNSWSYATSYVVSTSNCCRETNDGYKLLIPVSGCSKEDISVSYITEGNVIKIKAESKVEGYSRNYDNSYIVPAKYNLDELECSLKNGLLTILVPYKKASKPKEVKIS